MLLNGLPLLMLVPLENTDQTLPSLMKLPRVLERDAASQVARAAALASRQAVAGRPAIPKRAWRSKSSKDSKAQGGLSRTHAAASALKGPDSKRRGQAPEVSQPSHERQHIVSQSDSARCCLDDGPECPPRSNIAVAHVALFILGTRLTPLT